jgi:YVTN family beta-propeller protein
MATRDRITKLLVRFAAFWVAAAGMASCVVSQTPSRALLVLEKDDEKLAIVDPASLKIVGRVPSGGAPHEIVASADGKFAYISNYASQQLGQLKTISVIDLAAQKALTPVDLGALRAPHGIAFADGKVYFTAEGNKVIGRYDPTTHQVDWLMGTGQNSTHMLVLAKDLKTIFTANIGSNSVCAIMQSGTNNNWNVTTIATGKGPEGIDLSPDGKEVWAANSGDGSVSIIDVASKKATETVDVKTKHSNRLKFTPDGKLVLISDAGGDELIVVDAATRKERKRVKVGKGPEGTLVQPDGSRAYVALSGENAVAVIDLKTLEVTAKIATGNDPDGLAWAQRE